MELNSLVYIRVKVNIKKNLIKLQIKVFNGNCILCMKISIYTYHLSWKMTVKNKIIWKEIQDKYE